MSERGVTVEAREGLFSRRPYTPAPSCRSVAHRAGYASFVMHGAAVLSLVAPRVNFSPKRETWKIHTGAKPHR